MTRLILISRLHLKSACVIKGTHLEDLRLANYLHHNHRVWKKLE